MAIQIPNVGTGFPADQTGDSPWLATKKIAENFSDTNNAASKLVGTASGQIPLAQDVASTLTEKAIDVTSIKAGAASYKRGWRKLTASFGSGASTITIAHGVSNIVGVTVSAKVTGVSYYPNDVRATHQFTVRAGGVNLIIEKSAGATALDGAPLTIYIDEEL